MPARPRSSAPAAAPSAPWPSRRPTPRWSKPSSPTSLRWPSCSTTASSSARRPAAGCGRAHLFGHELRATTRWQPDIATLRGGPARIVVAIGDDSAGQLCDRTSTALAAALGTEPTMFPGGHIAFVDDPDGFATRLRSVLHES